MRRKAIGLAVLAPLLFGALLGSPVAGASLPVRPSPALAAAAPDPGVLARVRPAVVRIVALVEVADEPGAPRLGTSSGSGFVITSGGLVVTNYHVVAGADGPVDVYLEGRDKPVAGDVVGASECSDLAVVRIPAKGLPEPLDWASEPTGPGDGILAMGYPAGQPRLVVTEGVVQGGTGPGPDRWADVGLAISHSAHTEHGDSGGAAGGRRHGRGRGRGLRRQRGRGGLVGHRRARGGRGGSAHLHPAGTDVGRHARGGDPAGGCRARTRPGERGGHGVARVPGGDRGGRRHHQPRRRGPHRRWLHARLVLTHRRRDRWPGAHRGRTRRGDAHGRARGLAAQGAAGRGGPRMVASPAGRERAGVLAPAPQHPER